MISESRSTPNQPHSSFIDFCSCKPTVGAAHLRILDTLKEISRTRRASESIDYEWSPLVSDTCGVIEILPLRGRPIKTRKVAESLIPRAGNGEKSLAH